MAGRIVSVIGWRTAALLKENAGFLEQAMAKGRLRPKEGRLGAGKARSLTLFDDGTCELGRSTAAAVIRRLRAPAVL